AAGEQVALVLEVGRERPEVAVGQRQGFRDRVLERPAAYEREELLRGAYRVDDLGGPGDPAHLPAGEAERLARRADRDGALAHAVEGGERDMLAVVDEVLVHLVGDHEQVVSYREVGDGLGFRPGQHHAGRVVRAVEQQQPGLAGYRRGELVQVGAEARSVQRERNAGAACHRDVGRV